MWWSFKISNTASASFSLYYYVATDRDVENLFPCYEIICEDSVGIRITFKHVIYIKANLRVIKH